MYIKLASLLALLRPLLLPLLPSTTTTAITYTGIAIIIIAEYGPQVLGRLGGKVLGGLQLVVPR